MEGAEVGQGFALKRLKEEMQEEVVEGDKDGGMQEIRLLWGHFGHTKGGRLDKGGQGSGMRARQGG